MPFIRKTSFASMKEAVENSQRLTRKQCEALLHYAQAKDGKITRLLQDCYHYEIDLAVVRDDYERCVREWNLLVTMLKEVLGIDMYAREFDEDGNPLWTVAQNGNVISRGHISVADAYASVLKERLLIYTGDKE